MNIIYYYIYEEHTYEYIQYPTNGDFWEIINGRHTGRIYSHNMMQNYLRLKNSTRWETAYYYD